jgi:Carboxypeptidase regulatory-like domain/TonB dependent receptor
MKPYRPPFILALTLCVFGLNAWAGTQNATVKGSVYASGVGLAGATVHLINAGIGFSQTQITGSDGTYTFNSVPPAENYLISVEHGGFVPRVLTDIVIHVYDDKDVIPPFLLEAIAPANSSPEAPQTPTQVPSQPKPQAPVPATRQASKAPSVSLDLLSTTQSGVVDSRWVHNLPLVNRDFIDLALLVPGTYPVEQGSELEGASLVVNGARSNMNNFLLDGADNNDYTINQSLPFQIVEAMQEFRVQASTENAEFGRSGGAQINVVSRSGSNAIHGELFEFNRNSALSARNFFSAYSGGTFNQYAREVQILGFGNPLTDPTLAGLYNQRNPFVNQNQFGGNIGGPLFMKDKLFGFLNWESFRLANPRPLFEEVPGTVFRSASACQAALGVTCDPTALGLFNLYPSPNVPVTPFTDPAGLLTPSGDGAFNIAQTSNRTASDNLLERVDFRLSSRTSLSFKHNIQWINQLQAGNVPADTAYPGSGTRVNGRNQNVSFNYVQQFTPRTANEFRFGWNRFRLTTTAQDASVDLAALGFQNLNPNVKGLPSITIGGASGASATLAPDSSLGAGSATPTNRADNVFSVADNFSLTRGRHTLKVGGEFRDIRLNVNNEALGRGVIALFSVPITAQFGASNVASIARVCPQNLPSFSSVFAAPCTQFGNGFERNFSTRSAAGFVQDQWRLSRNFTLNFGIRYEVNTAPVERANRLVNFYPGLVTSLTPLTGTTGGLMRGGSATVYDPLGNVIGTAPHAAPRAGYDTDYNGWGPRFGFAWDPWKDGKTVVRGGYALMFDQQPLQASVNQLLNPPFVQQNLSAFTPFPFAALSDNFSACASFFTVGTGGCLSSSTNPLSGSDWFRFPYSIAAIDPHNKTPYVHQFHLGVERQLGNTAIFQVSYVGSAGHKLAALGNISQCPTAAFLADSSACFSGNSLGLNTTLNPFVFTSILEQENAANSNYSSLQVLLETRAFHRLQLRGFYQFAKSIDNSSSQQPQVFLIPPLISSAVVSQTFDNPGSFATANNISPTLTLEGNLPVITTRPNLPQESNNLAGERARSDFDVHHRAVIEYIYAVPRWAPKIGAGWELAGITTVQSGQPFSVYVDSLGTSLRPSLSGPVRINDDNPQAAIDNGTPMNTPGSAFNLKPTASLQPGALGRNTFIGPKLVNFDFAVIKNTFLSKSERANLMFKAEFFNLFNNVNFRQPYSKGGLVFFDFAGNFNCGAQRGQPAPCFARDPFFGQILQAFPARQIQFALKLSF